MCSQAQVCPLVQSICWGLFSGATILTQPVHAQAVSDFLSQYNNSIFFIVSELMGLLLTGEDKSQADQPNKLAEGHPM